MTNAYTLLETLYRKDQKQLLEWSVAFNRDTVTQRYKPTIYLYPDSRKTIYNDLSALLRSLDASDHLLHIQQESSLTAMYQGVRIPETAGDDKCLYLHEQGDSFIHSYRWKDKTGFDTCFYRFGLNDTLEQIGGSIHPELNCFYEAIRRGKEYNRLFGNWIQETEQGIQEIYLSFPSKPTLNWILNSFQHLLSDEVYSGLQQYREFRIKNIGFDSAFSLDPTITLYFSVPVGQDFPNSHNALMEYGKKYFEREKTFA